MRKAIVAMSLKISHILEVGLPGKIAGRILISEHGTGSNSADGTETNLQGAGNGAFTCSNDIVLGEGEDGGDVGVRSSNGEEYSEEFDAVGDGGSNEGEADNCDNGVGEDEGGSVVDFVCVVRGGYSDESG